MRSDTAGQHSLYGLEILRVLAALAVVIYHFPDYFYPDRSANDAFPFANALRFCYEFGHYAVPVFWTLSGYIFFWKYNKTIADRSISAAQFGMLRFSRLYPLHALTLLLVVVLHLIYVRVFGADGEPFYASGIVAFIAQLFFASNWFTTQYTFNGPVWSVSVEVLVYAMFFVAAWSGQLLRPGIVALVAAASGTAYWAACRILPETALVNLFWCAVCFFLGGLLSQARESMARHYVPIAAGLVSGATVLFFYRPTYVLEFALPVVAVFLFSCGSLWQCRLAERVAVAGNLTYGSYLLHFPLSVIMVMVMKAIDIPPDLAASRIFFLLYLGAVFAAAGISFAFFEKPMQDSIRRHNAPRPQPA
jgi:peptidoglycan/LPS O-acetylase OafA/YrhL